MGRKKWFEEMLESFKDDFDFRLESILIGLTEQICKVMRERNISRIQLAQRLKVSPPAVTKILNGSSNFTIKTLMSIADALEMNLNIEFRERYSIPVSTGLLSAKTTFVTADLPNRQVGKSALPSTTSTDDQMN